MGDDADKKIQDQLAEIMAINGKLPSPQHFLLDRLNSEVPFFTKLLRDINNTNNSLLKFIDLMQNSSSLVKQAAPVTGPASVALAATEFVRIPAVYFATWIITGQRPPFKLTTTAQWAYAGVGVALAAIALAIPVTAPFIAIGASLAASAIGVGAIYKMMKDRKNIKNELRDIDAKLELLTDIKSRISSLDGQLKGLDPKAPNYIEEHARVCQQIQEEHTKYIDFKNNVPDFQKLLDRKVLLEKKQEKLGSWAMTDKAVGAVFPALTALFVGLSLIFPPLIFGAAAVAGVGLLYGVGRFAVPRIAPYINSAFNSIGSWFSEKFGTKNEDKPSLTPSNEPRPHPAKDEEEINDSTLNITNMLAKSMGTDAVSDLQTAVQNTQDELLNTELIADPKRKVEEKELAILENVSLKPDEVEEGDRDSEELVA